MSASQIGQLGSLFQFIPSYVTTDNSLRNSRVVESKSGSIDHHHSRSNSINRLSEIVKAKNRRMSELKQREQKQEMYKTKQKFRTSEVSKRFTRMNGFFSEDSSKKQPLGYQKETDKIDKKHGLLRAIVKTKYEDGKYNQPNFYNESFNRLQKGFKDIKLKEVLSTKDQLIAYRQNEAAEGIINLMKSNIPVQMNPEVSGLTARTRIRLESCKSWALKHNRHSQFYEKKLHSSSASHDMQKDTIRERNRILNSIRSFVK